MGLLRICSVDEAGRGPLAGPVVAACVVITPDFKIKNKKLLEVNDSKKLSEKKRNDLFCILNEEMPIKGIGICDNETIDEMNIFQASFLAMKKAIKSIGIEPDIVLVDGKFKIPGLECKQQTIIKGDAQIWSIAAASILAKVTRDRLMEDFHQQYPGYGFNLHKGYATAMHLDKIKELGPSPIHRRSFSPLKNSYN